MVRVTMKVACVSAAVPCLLAASTTPSCADVEEEATCRQEQPARESVLLQVRSNVELDHAESTQKSECKPWCNWIWKNWQGKCTLSSGECSACPDCPGASPSPGTTSPTPAPMTTDPNQKPSDLPFSVMSWNILARQRTTSMKACHRNPSGDQETEEQTRERYTAAADFLVNDGADVVLLQDAEEKFFGFGPFNPFVQMRKDYAQFSCYNYEVSKTYSSGEYPLGPGPTVLMRRSLMEDSKVKYPHFRCIGSDDTNTGVGKTTHKPVCAILQSRGFPWTIASCKFSRDSFDDELSRLEEHFRVHQKIILAADLNDIPADEFKRKIDNSWLGQKGYVVPEEDGASASEVDCDTDATKNGAYFIVDSDVQVPEAVSWMAPTSPFGAGSPAAIAGASNAVPLAIGADKGTGPRY